MKLVLATLLALTPTAVLSEQIDYRPGGMFEESCFKYEYREEYVPGTSENPGYVNSYRDKIEVPCDRNRPEFMPPQEQSNGPVDDNSCIEGSIIGGIIGGGLGGVLATKDNWIWSIPTGVVGGAMTGCQIDGG